jgi:hypothetical protein
MTKLEARVKWHMNYCIHFDGRSDVCKAGINVRQLVGGETMGWGLRTPCLADHKECVVTCDNREFPTREAAEVEAKELEDRADRVLKSIKAAHEDAKTKGFKKGSGGKSSLPCPSGCGGTLHYTVASYDGHMHAGCTTEGCVSWME